MSGPRLNPTLFDKLVADLEMDGLREAGDSSGQGSGEVNRESLRFYSVAKVERFNENALRATVRRELNWIMNTTNLGAAVDLTPYPEVKTSVLNFGVPDLAGKALTPRVVQARARDIRDAIRAFEPRIDPTRLDVEPQTSVTERENAITYIIRGDISAAVNAMPVTFKTDVEVDTGAATVRD